MTIPAFLGLLAVIHLMAAVYCACWSRLYRAPWLRRRVQRRAERFALAAAALGLLFVLVA